ncbi:MAG: prolipoprotein diacylglyceryl transferase [Treponema sp.]|nr:prolipoprotein diacylglyceryl transferase [Treponema sp.]
MGFTFFGRFIPWYGFFIALGIVSALLLALTLCKLKSYDFDNCLILSAWLIGFGFLGAKLFYLILYFRHIDWSSFFSSLKYFSQTINSGFIFYGGFIGGLCALPLIKIIHKIDIKPCLQVLSPCVALAHSFGRIGCSFAGCCFGCPTNSNFYFIYSESISAPNGVKLFPVQGIEAFAVFLLAVFFTILILKEIKISIPKLYIVLYSIIRFILEFFRGDIIRGHLGLLSTSQIISLVLLAGTFILDFIHLIKARSK